MPNRADFGITTYYGDVRCEVAVDDCNYNLKHVELITQFVLRKIFYVIPTAPSRAPLLVSSVVGVLAALTLLFGVY